MKINFFRLMVVFIMSLQQSCVGVYRTEFDKTLSSIASRTGRQIEKEFKFLTYSGSGGGLACGYIEEEKLVFSVRKELNKDEAVIIISKILNEYLKNMYAEPKMQSYLDEYPFTYKNLEIVFFVHDEDDNRVYHPGIGNIHLSNGKISFTTNSKSEIYILKEETYVKESYEEAAKRLGVWPPVMRDQ